MYIYTVRALICTYVYTVYVFLCLELLVTVKTSFISSIRIIFLFAQPFQYCIRNELSPV